MDVQQDAANASASEAIVAVPAFKNATGSRPCGGHYNEDYLPMLAWQSNFSLHSSHHLHPAGHVHPDWYKCLPAQSPCPAGSLPGCCETGGANPEHDPLFNDTFAWLQQSVTRNRGGYIMFSLSGSDPACALRRSLKDVLSHTNGSLVVVHIGCASSTTLIEREQLRGIDPERVLVNPTCVPVRRTMSRGYGSILHAHMVNVGLVSRLIAAKRLPEPSHVVLVSADMVWLRGGVERYVRTHGASTHRAGIILAHRQAGLENLAAGFDADWHALLAHAPQLQLLNALASDFAPNTIPILGLRQKHEGSFYPWSTVEGFYRFLLARGPLGRLNLRNCGPCYSHCVEEVYLPTYAAQLLRVPNATGARCSELRWDMPGFRPPAPIVRWLTTARSEESRREMYFGCITVKHGHFSMHESGVYAEKQTVLKFRGQDHTKGC